MSTAPALLVVDDNELNRDALSRRLRYKGYTVDLAADGPAALELVARGSYGLVLLDVEMPGMSGLQVLERLRATYSRVELPVIMVTARSQAANIVEALQLGANDYVTKPVDFAVALARIETHLSLKLAMEHLRESEERYALAVQGSNDGIWDWNIATNTVHWSPRWKAMLGYGPDELGSSIDEWLGRVHQDDAARVKKALDAHLAAGSGFYESEHRILHRDNTYRWVLCRGAATRDANGVVTRLAGSVTDITESKVSDALTGLPNRLFFVDAIGRAMAKARQQHERTCALVILGLNRFSALTDSLGLLTAERLLVAVAERLDTQLRALESGPRAQRTSTIARLGGDEFAVLLEDIADAAEAIRVADELRASLQRAFDIDGEQVFTSAAAGVAVISTAHKGPEDALQDAAIALHRARTEGGGGRELFDPAMRAGVISRQQVETNLRQAIESGAFIVYYQPIVSLKTGDIASFEALVRWRHPVLGIVGASEFIAVAEETGILLDIERQTLVEACRQMRIWQEQLGGNAPRTVCVNVSSKRFALGGLEDDIPRLLAETGLHPSALKLEITESAFISDLAAAQDTLSALSSLGVQWSLDDFGTGYSSLSYLHRLRVQTVKLDRSFVSRIGLEHGGSEMVRAIVTLAHTLETDVVGEGVETPEQLDSLVEFGCDYGQGYLFSRAVDTAGATRLLREQPWRLSDRDAPAPAVQGRLKQSTPLVA